MTLYEKFGVGCFGLLTGFLLLCSCIELAKINIVYGLLFLLGIGLLVLLCQLFFKLVKKIKIFEYICIVIFNIFLIFIVNMFVNNWFNSIAYICTIYFIFGIFFAFGKEKFPKFSGMDEYSEAIDNYQWDDAVEILEKALENPKNKRKLCHIIVNLLSIYSYKKQYDKILSLMDKFNLMTNMKYVSTFISWSYFSLIKSNRIPEAKQLKEDFINKYSNNARYKAIIKYLNFLDIHILISEQKYDEVLQILEDYENKPEKFKDCFQNLREYKRTIYGIYYEVFKSKNEKESAIKYLKKTIAYTTSSEGLHLLLLIESLQDYIQNN